MHKCTCEHACIHVHAHMCMYTFTHMHTFATYRHIHIYARVHTLAHTQMLREKYGCLCIKHLSKTQSINVNAFSLIHTHVFTRKKLPHTFIHVCYCIPTDDEENALSDENSFSSLESLNVRLLYTLAHTYASDYFRINSASATESALIPHPIEPFWHLTQWMQFILVTGPRLLVRRNKLFFHCCQWRVSR